MTGHDEHTGKFYANEEQGGMKKKWQKHWGHQFFIANRHENRTSGEKHKI